MAELPRSTRLGPPQGVLWHQLDLTGEKLFVNRRYFKQVVAADEDAA